ncbi:hypothetical protein JVX98_12925 [Ensifer sp. PDNC004]|uniref:hypothetical protein n=1 Tax=Ensifer sp. PDNC004 TaxID=2811423 RepID=UPI001963B006|nr:hypothetical protein [Ensifer sp. PDNC004]QRY69126.1 hypothetical protein JVX98_12925 [Ensifer sp. PDNC004]
MIRLVRLAIFAVATLLVAAGIGHSADKRPYSLKYALIFEGADPVAGEASCISGMACEFPGISTRDLKFKFKRSTGELEVDCFDCSFANGGTKYWCGYCHEIGIFQGRDYETLLVIRKRPLVGTLLLRY